MPGPWISKYLCRRDKLPSNSIHRPCQAIACHRSPIWKCAYKQSEYCQSFISKQLDTNKENTTSTRHIPYACQTWLCVASSRILCCAQVPSLSGNHSLHPDQAAGLGLEALCRQHTTQVRDLAVREGVLPGQSDIFPTVSTPHEAALMPGVSVPSLQCFAGPNSYAGPNSSLLDAFYYGKAFAETLNEKLGTVLDDVLANIGKQDAERREALRCRPSSLMQTMQRMSEEKPDSSGPVLNMSRHATPQKRVHSARHHFLLTQYMTGALYVLSVLSVDRFDSCCTFDGRSYLRAGNFRKRWRSEPGEISPRAGTLPVASALAALRTLRQHP